MDNYYKFQAVFPAHQQGKAGIESKIYDVEVPERPQALVEETQDSFGVYRPVRVNWKPLVTIFEMETWEGKELNAAKDIFNFLSDIYFQMVGDFRVATYPQPVLDRIKDKIGTGHVALWKDGVMVEAWMLKGMWPESIEFGKIELADIRINKYPKITIKVVWRFDSVEYENEKDFKIDQEWANVRNEAGQLTSVAQGDPPGSCRNLDIDYDYCYGTPFVQNESHEGWKVDKVDKADKKKNKKKSTQYNFILEHTPIVPGTLTGIIFHFANGDEYATQTFVADVNGDFYFTNTIKDGKNIFAKGQGQRLNLTTGELTLTFNDDPGKIKIVICYEYNCETK